MIEVPLFRKITRKSTAHDETDTADTKRSALIQVGILGFSRREGTFAEVGLRSWEEAGCAAVEKALMTGNEAVYVVHRPLVIRSSRAEAERILRDWCDVPALTARCDLILTVGGTGYSEIDFLPEVTRSLLHKEAPGIAEYLRRAAAESGSLPDAVSRGVAGMRGQTLLINVPGTIKGIADPKPLTTMTRALVLILPALLAAVRD